MAIEGVDYAFSRPSIPQLAAAGKRFACRYGGPGTSPKHLTLAEAQELTAAGMSVVANAEGAADGLLGGWNAGVSWARSAEEHFRRCGMPADRPIYLSVDFDCTSSQWPTVAQALRGAASVLGAARVGVYGGRRSIEWARRDKVAQWFWQTYAWSAGVWVPGNHCEQYKNGVALAGGTVDLNRALVPDFGQWTTGDDMTPEQAEQLRQVHELTRWNIHPWTGDTLQAVARLEAEAKADAARDKIILAAIEAGGISDPAAALAFVKAEAEKTRTLLVDQHAQEMAALNQALLDQKAAMEAEKAGLQAELDRLNAAGTNQ